MVVGFIRARLGVEGFAWVHSDAPSYRPVPKDRRVHSVSRGFTLVRLGVVGFIGVRAGSVGRAYASPWYALFRARGYSGSRGFTFASLGVGDFIRVSTPALQRVARFVRGLHNRLYGSSRSFGLALVHLGAPRCRRFHSG